MSLPRGFVGSSIVRITSICPFPKMLPEHALGNLRLRSWSTCTIGVASDAEDQDATHTVTIPTNTTVKNTRSACIPLVLRQ